MNNQHKVALITGANSGIGYESAAQFAEAGYGKVILACRTVEKGMIAKRSLIERTGKRVFDTLAIDTSEPKSAHVAADIMQQRNQRVDVLVLNAAASMPEPTYNSDGIEITFASTLFGHHVLTMRLLNDGLLSKNARIIIAGSEGARGNLPGMNIPEFESFATEHFKGDMEKALEAIVRIQSPYKYSSMNAYATAKTFVAWWAASLSRRLPDGMTVNAVSPGSAPSTNFVRSQGFVMRKIMPVMMKLMGMAGSIAVAARRYIDAADFDDNVTGKFFASPKGKMLGKLEIQENAHFYNVTHQEAWWNVIVHLTNSSEYAMNKAA